MPSNSWVTVAKGRVVDKSRAFAPTYPQMRNSDLHSSGELVRLEKVSVFSPLKMQTCFSKETNIPTDLEQHMLFFLVKNNASTGEGESADGIPRNHK